jgi:hypothetical protein
MIAGVDLVDLALVLAIPSLPGLLALLALPALRASGRRRPAAAALASFLPWLTPTAAATTSCAPSGPPPAGRSA